MWHSFFWKKKTSLWKKKHIRDLKFVPGKNGAKCSQIEDETYKHHVLPYLRNLEMHEEMESLHIQNLFPSVGQISLSLLSYWPHRFRKRPSHFLQNPSMCPSNTPRKFNIGSPENQPLEKEVQLL